MALRFPATSDASLRLPKAGEPPHGLHQFPQYRGVSNFNVVLFCQQAGLSLEGMLVAAGRFARVSSSRRFRISSKGLAYAFLVTLPFSIVLVPAGAFYGLYVVDACITEVRKDGISRSNMRFQITETDCSTLGEDASVSVFGLDETGTGRTLLFKYGPASYDLPLPEIAVPDNDTILISVPVVSNVFLR
jgi:hypothetical protein